MQRGYCADRYLWLYSNDTTTYLLDTQTLSVSRDNNWTYFDAWFKRQYNEKGVQEQIQIQEKYGGSTEGYEKLSHSILHRVYATNRSELRKMEKNIQIIDYDIDGKVLYNFTFSSSQSFEDIIPDSIDEVLYININAYSIAAGIKYPK